MSWVGVLVGVAIVVGSYGAGHVSGRNAESSDQLTAEREAFRQVVRTQRVYVRQASADLNADQREREQLASAHGADTRGPGCRVPAGVVRVLNDAAARAGVRVPGPGGGAGVVRWDGQPAGFRAGVSREHGAPGALLSVFDP